MQVLYKKGKGAQINTHNRFSKLHLDTSNDNDEMDVLHNPNTRFYEETPKTILSKFDSPDVPYGISLNPYQGCEHGCVYCYARNTHEYWGFSAGLDFESNIVIKRNSAIMLENVFLSKHWKPKPIMISGNTDCYQPVEKKLKITRSILKIALKYRNPVALITKNSLIIRDIDLIAEMARMNLIRVMITVNSLNETLRQKMEPRTTTYKKRLEAVRLLSDAGVPTGIMVAPIIPGLNIHEIPAIVKAASEAGASQISHAVLRLNGKVADIFNNWLVAVYPDKAEKVMSQTASIHGGQVNDSRFLKRMLGEGKLAEMTHQLMKTAIDKYLPNANFPELDCSRFRKGGMYTIW